MYIYPGLEIDGFALPNANHFSKVIRQIFWTLRTTFGRLRITF